MKDRKYKHIIFDIDGTLLDTEKAILLSLQDTLFEVARKEVSLEELRFALGIPGEVALRALGISDAEPVNRLWNEKLLDYSSSIRLFKGIPELLSALKAERYALGIVTSKTRQEYAADFALPFGLDGYFDMVICVEDAPRPKPHPDPLQMYLSLSGVCAQEVLYVGDTLYDCQCAQSAGVDFGLALWGNTVSLETSASFLFKKPSDVLTLLQCSTILG